MHRSNDISLSDLENTPSQPRLLTAIGWCDYNIAGLSGMRYGMSRHSKGSEPYSYLTSIGSAIVITSALANVWKLNYER
jgi:hypothetical protein